MKKVLFLLFSLGFIFTSFTLFRPGTVSNTTNLADEGINFQNISFEEALKLAKEQRKIIFIDAYTEWCGPCKKMAATTFKDPVVGKYFNDRFINLKIEMEKSADGPEIARKYRVRAYPTLLFIDEEGKLVHSILGLHSSDELMAKVKEGIK